MIRKEAIDVCPDTTAGSHLQTAHQAPLPLPVPVEGSRERFSHSLCRRVSDLIAGWEPSARIPAASRGHQTPAMSPPRVSVLGRRPQTIVTVDGAPRPVEAWVRYLTQPWILRLAIRISLAADRGARPGYSDEGRRKVTENRRGSRQVGDGSHRGGEEGNAMRRKDGGGGGGGGGGLLGLGG